VVAANAHLEITLVAMPSYFFVSLFLIV